MTAAGGGGMPPPQGAQAAAPPTGSPDPPTGMQPSPVQPPAGMPPAGVPGVLPPPPVKRKTASGWKIAIIIGLAVILLFAVAGTLLAVFVFKTVKAPVDVTNRYIEAVNEGDAEEAWDLLHPDSPFKEEYTLSTFESQVVEVTVGLRTWSANEVDVRDSRATVKVDMEDRNGEDFRLAFDVRKDGGEWKVYDYGYISD